ncbi:unnamed protein product [Diamesa hyperborea]
MESEIIAEFIRITSAKPNDAVSCLRAFEFDLKKALIDYNDISTQNYFKSKTKAITSEPDSMDKHLTSPTGKNNLHHAEQFIDKKIREESGKKASVGNQKDSYESRLSANYKPILSKSDSIDVVDYKKLARGISRATENVNIVSRVRGEFAMDFHTKQQQQASNLYFVDTPDFTFTLPDLSIYAEDFRKFLEKDLIECSTMNSLESSTRLNWWVEMGICRKLWPLATTGDGNCLLHAASLGMWGFHDRRLTLRKALHNILSEGECRDALWRRWRFHQTRVNKEAGLVFSETEWAKEWEELVGIASPEPRHNNKNANSARRRSVVLEKNLSLTCVDSIDGNAVYESLEEIHVLALAYVLRRPIIVISDVVLMDINGEALAPINFGGVYLPYDISPNDCHRVPLLLAYDTAHFSALVTMETQNDFPAALIPLTDFENILLPIQFGIDPGSDFNWRDYDGREGNWALSEVEHIALLKEYLEIIYASPVGSPEDEINKSKSAKLQSVAKQFGSIGRNMSKKIKKNIGSITKLGGRINQSSSNKLNSNASTIPTLGGGFVNGKFRLLCAQLKAKRHDYQEEMIKNYLDCAQERFIKQMRNAVTDKTGKVSTPRYGTGNSRFYTQSDTESHDVIKRLPSVKRLNELDQTLYLSKSTFFNDLKPQHNILGLPVTSPTSISPTQFDSQGTSSLPVVHDRTSYSSTECRTRGCSFYGSQNTNYYCSKCCQEQQSQLHSTYRKLQTDI